jgi:transmembrane sensor
MTDPRRTHDSRRRLRTTEQAAAWYIDQREGLADTRQRAFLAWLRSSPEHIAEYLAIAGMHGDIKASAAMESLSGGELVALAGTEHAVVSLWGNDADGARNHRADAGPTTTRRYSRILLGACASVLGLAMLGGAWLATTGGQTRVYTSAADAIADLDLADGSQVHLDRDSAISVHFDGRQRRIELLRGAALVDVGKDPVRPLLMVFGNKILRDIGTVFEVRRGEDGDAVTVVSGQVKIWTQADSWLAGWRRRLTGAPTAGAAVASLSGGQRLRLDEHGKAVSTAPVDIARATAWLPADIRFQRSTVADVARRFNAYTTRPLVIEDTRIAAMHLTGAFHAHDVDAFVAYLETLPDVRVVRGSDRVRVLARAPANTGDKRL